MRVATRILLALLLALPILSLYLGQDRVPTEERPSVSLNSIFNPTYPYDEQLGMSFTQDFTSIAYNVTAVEQSGPDGPGPAYLLNGLSNLGYWYQVGLSWNWLYLTGTGYYHGFQMFYEVFDPSGNSIFPTNGGGSQYLSVNAGDTVLLSLYFSGNSVIMLTKDAYTGSVVWESYGAQGATYFVGSPDYSHGFFTGLMTEEYHSSPYYGGELPVTYLNKNYALTNAWLWIDEYNTVDGRSLFSDRTHLPVSLDPSKGRYFESNGTAEASNVYG